MSDSKYSDYLTHAHDDEYASHDDNNHSNIDYKKPHVHSHGHGHSHNFRETNSRILFWCLVFTFSFAIVEGVGGYITHSVALQSDAVHMLTDAAGLLIAYIANTVSKRPATVNLTFGYGKAEALGALINCIFTGILTIGLLIEAAMRFLNPVEVHGTGLFIIAGIGFLANAAIALTLSKNLGSLNTRAAFIHALGDLLGSFVAIVAGLIIYFTGFYLADPILSLIIIALLIISNYNLIKKSSIVLMSGVPEDLDYQQIGHDLEAIPDIESVHDLHVWYMSANKAALSAHIVAKNPYSWHTTLRECQKMLLEKHHIEHVTIQHEFDINNLNMQYCEVK